MRTQTNKISKYISKYLVWILNIYLILYKQMYVKYINLMNEDIIKL